MRAFLAEWNRTRPKRRPRHIGLDEIQRGKGQRFWTVLSDVVHGEVIGFRQDRTEAAATALLTEELTGGQHAAITAVCPEMHRPYFNAVGGVLTHAACDVQRAAFGVERSRTKNEERRT